MTFNTERALAVANAIRNAPAHSFDMRFYYDVRVPINPDEPDDALLDYEYPTELDSETPIKTGGLGECGTVGCIAGWTVSMFHDVLVANGEEFVFGDDWEMAAAELLGLDESEAHSLFMGRWYNGGMSEITRTDAAAQLEYQVEHFKRHGTVDL